MVTFDGNGVATRESQAFFENKRMKIVMDPTLEDHQKASRIGDLYNQYGIEYGTFNRIKVLYVPPIESGNNLLRYDESESSMRGLIYFFLFICFLFFLCWLDELMAEHGIHFSFLDSIGWVLGKIGDALSSMFNSIDAWTKS